MLKIIDNEHQSLCVTTGSRTASSNPTTILSTTAARLGTSSSTNHGASCPSDCANGPTGSDQWDLVLHDTSCNWPPATAPVQAQGCFPERVMETTALPGGTSYVDAGVGWQLSPLITIL